MKKPLAALATTALAVLTTVGLATPASADTVVKLSTYFTASDIGQETGAGYPANEWFLSELSSTWTQGSVASSATGLDIDASGASTVVQLLNQGVVTPAEASGFLAAFGSMRVLASNQNWTLQLAIFGNGALGTEYTTLRPAATGPASASDPWITSGAIDNNGTTIAAGSTDTLTNFVNALYAGGTTPELLAYGIWVQNTTVSLYGTTAFADTSVFTPIPTRSITPNPATPASPSAARGGSRAPPSYSTSTTATATTRSPPTTTAARWRMPTAPSRSRSPSTRSPRRARTATSSTTTTSSRRS